MRRRMQSYLSIIGLFLSLGTSSLCYAQRVDLDYLLNKGVDTLRIKPGGHLRIKHIVDHTVSELWIREIDSNTIITSCAVGFKDKVIVKVDPILPGRYEVGYMTWYGVRALTLIVGETAPGKRES